jgi:hypothetical protein
VPSSTSSSDPRPIPGGRWGAAWLAALGLVVALTWGLEHAARVHGERPSVNDDPVRWSLARHTVDGDPSVVAFLGASRMALGYSAHAFAEAAPELRGVQLAIDGVPALGVLEDLANDDQFRGIAVVDLIEWDVGVIDDLDTVRPYVKRSHALWRAPGALVNRLLATEAQARLAVLTIGSHRFINAVLGKLQWPPPAWVAADRDRSSRADYRLAPPAALAAKATNRLATIGSPLDPQAWLAALARDVDPLIAQIRAHGGDVVLVHMPLSGRLAEVFDHNYPRASYWDVYAARSAAHLIHYRDVPGMAELTCPDEMHLDQADQAAFTRALVGAMRARGVFRGRER